MEIINKYTNIALQRGSRAFITGMSGSGKTTLALEICKNLPSPLVIINTKHDPAILEFARQYDIPIHYGLKPWKEIEDDIIIIPNDHDISFKDGLLIDKWLGTAFTCNFAPSIYIDEGYQVGASDRKLGVGVTGLWTRARAFKFIILLGAQRPAWISKFVLTESDVYYILMLRDINDRKKLANMTGYPELEEIIKPKEFWYIKQGEDPILCNPIKVDNNVNNYLTNKQEESKITNDRNIIENKPRLIR